MSIEVKIVADSKSVDGNRLTTFQLRYPRFIHAEVMTHRVFSRNASSSRAIPVKKMISQVWNDPAMPLHWGANQPGMQANTQLSGVKKAIARGLWKSAGKFACVIAYGMIKVGLHKQVANRILEPWQYIHVVLSATEFDNFFALRDHKDAQPEIQALARAMRVAMDGSAPEILYQGQWHLPYITPEDMTAVKALGWGNAVLRKISAARCCRVSYLKHDGTQASVEEDLKLCDKLAASSPIHASPFEHQATPDISAYTNGVKGYLNQHAHGNFVGWVQHRKLIESAV